MMNKDIRLEFDIKNGDNIYNDLFGDDLELFYVEYIQFEEIE